MLTTARVLVMRLTVKSPIMGDYRGEKLVAVIPNSSGFRGHPSTNKPWLVHSVTVTNRGDIERFEKEVKAMGYYWD